MDSYSMPHPHFEHFVYLRACMHWQQHDKRSQLLQPWTSCRFGECVWDEAKASVLKAMLVSAVQRRFPPGMQDFVAGRLEGQHNR
jgi:hypothetical protein